MGNNLEDIRLDDLQYNDLKIYQYKDGYCFTSDAVILANLVRAKNPIIVDFCSGSGVVGILAGEKNFAKKVYLIEIQKKYACLCEQSIKENNLTNKYSVLNKDLKRISKDLGFGIADIVTCNPPYKKADSSVLNEKDEIKIAKHEITTNLLEIIQSASQLLRFGGKFYICNKEERCAEIICLCRKFNLEPKELFIRKSVKGGNIIFIMATLGGKEGMKIKIINDDKEVIRA